MNLTSPQKGFTLFYAVLVASLLLAIGLAIFNITFKEVVLSSGARESAGAFYAADTALECALYWDLKHSALLAPAFGFYGDSLASDLSGYWRLEETSGLTALDSSGGGNNGTLRNMPGDSTTWVAGRVGSKAAAFDGLNDYIELGNGAGLNFAANEDFSISLWFLDPADLAGMIFSMRNTTNGQPVVDIGLGTAGVPTIVDRQVTVLVRDDAGGSYATVNGPVVNNNWHHVVVTRTSGGRIELFVDNVSYGSNTSAGADGAITTNERAIGAELEWVRVGYLTPDTQYFAGTVDDVRIYRRALSAAERAQLFARQSNLQFVDPVAQNSFIMCAGADVSNPSTGWDDDIGWSVELSPKPATPSTPASATTTFDMLLDNGRCATVTVVKNVSTTTITSRGYNNCNLTDPRRVERAIKATY